MPNKTLRRKAKAAKKRSSFLSYELWRLTQPKTLSPDDKQRLPKLKDAAHRANQVTSRLERRLAKATKADYLPRLCRFAFKKTATYHRLAKEKGLAAAQAWLFAQFDEANGRNKS